MSVEPVIVYPPELPVSAARDEIARAIRDHQVVIVAGATGSGKTTQLPKICLELGRTSIAHTQPRRIAARTIAERIADEMQVPLGSTVGYKVRFTDKVSADTRVALVTDGILLNEIHRDRLLRRYDTIIVDEAHERSLNIDFLLGYLRRILPKRPDLKVIVTSATIDPESFARHFAAPPAEPGGEPVPAPVIEVSGRTYPVEIRYRPLDGADDADTTQEIPDAEGGETPSSRGRAQPAPSNLRSSARPAAKGGRDADDVDEVGAVVAALRELDREPAGDVLVFFPGEAEIRDAADAIRGAYQKDAAPTEVLPLYGRLSPPNSTASSNAPPSPVCAAASSSPRTSPRRASPSPASGTSSTPAPRASRATATGRRSSGCRSRPSRRRRRSSARAARGARRPASRSGSTPRTTSSAGRSTPSPRFCGRRWHPSSCRCSRSGSATSRRSPSSPRPIRAV